MQVATQQQDSQQVAEGAAILPCNAPDPIETKSDAKTMEVTTNNTDTCNVEPEANHSAVSEAEPNKNAEPSSEAFSTEKEEAMTEPTEEKNPEKAEDDPVPKGKIIYFELRFDQLYLPAGEEINENDTSIEVVTIIKQKRKFDEIQEDAIAEETVAKKIKFEE